MKKQKNEKTQYKDIPRNIQNWRLLTHVLVDCSIWLIVIVSSQLRWPFAVPIAAVGFAIFSFRSFAIMHDAVHSAAHRSIKVNRWVGEMYGVFSFLPYGSWKVLHLEHHRWTGNMEKDPSMEILKSYKKRGNMVPTLITFSWRSWIPVMGFIQHLVFWKRCLKEKSTLFALFCPLYLISFSVFFGWGTLVFGGLLYLGLVEVVNFPHHLGLKQYDGDFKVPPKEQNVFARSCDYPAFLAKYVLLNFNLHTEHHMYPAHPWYQLDQIAKALNNESVHVNRCGAFEWILKNRARGIDKVLGESIPLGNKNAA